MTTRSSWIILPLLSLLGSLRGEQPSAECGSSAVRRQEEVFLHHRHLAARAKQGLNPTADAVTVQSFAATNRDVGQIAVIEDSGGVVRRRNLFNLDHTTLTLRPVSGGGHTAQLGGDSVGPPASAARALL